MPFCVWSLFGTHDNPLVSSIFLIHNSATRFRRSCSWHIFLLRILINVHCFNAKKVVFDKHCMPPARGSLGNMWGLFSCYTDDVSGEVVIILQCLRPRDVKRPAPIGLSCPVRNNWQPVGRWQNNLFGEITCKSVTLLSLSCFPTSILP